jgi:hypothetical protein
VGSPIFGDIRKKKEFLEGIQDLDIISEGRNLMEERKEDMSKELEKIVLFEEVS